jgi:tetratricopeptide (TPR) repeat protein
VAGAGLKRGGVAAAALIVGWAFAADLAAPVEGTSQAEALRLAGDVEGAWALYVEALREEPTSAAALAGAARALESYDEDAVLGFLENAAAEPGIRLEPEAAAILAAAYARRGDRERARRVLAEGGDYGGRRSGLAGELALAARDYPTAIKEFKDARAAGEAAASYLLGEALLAAGRYDEAENSLNEFLKEFPYAVGARCARGEVYYRQGRVEAAAADFAEALRYDPDDTRALMGRAATARLAGDWGEAIRLYGRALDADPGEGRALLGMADAYEHVDVEVARAKRAEYETHFGGR